MGKSHKPLYTNTKPFLDPFTATIKDFNGHGKKLTVSKVKTRQSGLSGAFDSLSQKEYQEAAHPDDPAPPIAATDDTYPTSTVETTNKSPPDDKEEPPQRLANNLSRARTTIFELALCNDWEYFITLTLDPKKYDRTNLPLFRKDLSRFIRNYRAKYNANIRYLLIPENHKDGAWHMHGFLTGLPESHLRLFTLDEHLPYYIRRKLEAGQSVFEWEAYRKKFGFCDIEPIRNLEATSKYVTKYVTKAFHSGVIEAGGHLYYASQKLNRSTVIARGQIKPDANIDFDYENEYVKTKWYPASENPEDYIEDDPVTKTIRRLRQERSPTAMPPWEPTYDTETGEIFPTPFDNYDNSYQEADIPPTPKTEQPPKPPPKGRRTKPTIDKNQLSLPLDKDGFINVEPTDTYLPFD